MSEHPFIDAERRDLPSASHAEADVACPGRHAYVLRLRREGRIPADDTSPDAERGRRIHEWLAWHLTGETKRFELPADELGAAVAIADNLRELVDSLDIPPDRHMLCEERMWINMEGRQVHSAKLDVLMTWSVNDEYRALVTDYKTGYWSATPPDRNLQLRRQALHVWRDTGISEIDVAIVTPDRFSVCHYSEPDLRLAWTEFLGHMRAMDPSGTLLVPGEHCQMCPANSVCDRLRARNHELAEIDRAGSVAIQTIPDGELPELLDLCERMEVHAKGVNNRIEEIRSEALRRVQEGRGVPGWTSKEGNRRLTVTDVLGLQDDLLALGASEEDFLGCLKAANGKVEDLVKRVTGLKGAKAKDRAREIMLARGEERRDAPKLVRGRAELTDGK